MTDCRREEVGGGRAEGPSATGDEGQATMSLTPDIDGTCISIFESLHIEGSYIAGLTTWT